MHRWLCVALASMLVLAGCLGGPTAPTDPDEDVAPTQEPPAATNQTAPPQNHTDEPVTAPPTDEPTHEAPGGPQPVASRAPVVALIDSGINPYHVAFAGGPRGHPSSYLPGYPTGSTMLPLDLGTYAADADAAIWDAVHPRTLYHIPGTRVIGAITFSAGGHILDVGPDGGHGTGTAGIVATRAPTALIVMIQSDATHLPEALAWAAKQDWIDIVNLSWSVIANVPVPIGVYEPSRAVVASGKVLVASAGNDPTPGIGDEPSGPPWIISVGGTSPGYGEEPTAAKTPDVVANYTQRIPRGDSATETVVAYGTSFGAPEVAGAMAKALHLIRNANGVRDIDGVHLMLRAALNATAVYWDTTQYNPPYVPPPLPILPAPWVQMGWGYVSGSMGETLAQQALGNGVVEAKPAAATTYMELVQTARVLAWS